VREKHCWMVEKVWLKKKENRKVSEHQIRSHLWFMERKMNCFGFDEHQRKNLLFLCKKFF